MDFNPVVNLGEVIETLTFVVTVIGAFFAVRYDVRRVSDRENQRHEQNSRRLDRIESEMEKQTAILVNLAEHKATLDGIMQRLASLEQHRNGFSR